MGEYIYLDKNEQEQISLLATCQTSSIEPANKMQARQSICNQSD